MLTVRLARDKSEIDAAQHLRYRVFYEELSARPDHRARVTRRDRDRYDAACDHMLVVRHAKPLTINPIELRDGELIATYRLLTQDRAGNAAGFYSQSEFDIAPLLKSMPQLDFIELGRSCVLPPYRTRHAIEALWQGIWDYVRARKLDVMLGCASLPGTNPDALAVPLSYLAHNHRAPRQWRASAHPERYVVMNRLPRGHYDDRQAMRGLSPLIRGYLRVGAFIGDGAVIDDQFNTTDVLIILPVTNISQRYLDHFDAPPRVPLANTSQPLMS
jgi:putative hemolysin